MGEGNQDGDTTVPRLSLVARLAAHVVEQNYGNHGFDERVRRALAMEQLGALIEATPRADLDEFELPVEFQTWARKLTGSFSALHRVFGRERLDVAILIAANVAAELVRIQLNAPNHATATRLDDIIVRVRKLIADMNELPPDLAWVLNASGAGPDAQRVLFRDLLVEEGSPESGTAVDAATETAASRKRLMATLHSYTPLEFGVLPLHSTVMPDAIPASSRLLAAMMDVPNSRDAGPEESEISITHGQTARSDEERAGLESLVAAATELQNLRLRMQHNLASRSVLGADRFDSGLSSDAPLPLLLTRMNERLEAAARIARAAPEIAKKEADLVTLKGARLLLTLLETDSLDYPRPRRSELARRRELAGEHMLLLLRAAGADVPSEAESVRRRIRNLESQG